jgi:hypothetical protein
MKRLIAGLVLVLMTAGCSETDRRPTVSVDELNFCSELAEVACLNMFQCCTGAQIEEILGITISTTESECRRDVELMCEDMVAEEFDAYIRGTVALNIHDASLCLESLMAPEDVCFIHVFASEIPWSRWCQEPFFQGELAVNEDCLYSFECEGDLYCAADRKCRALPGFEEPCYGGPCSKGLYCDWLTDTCAMLKTSGQECGSDMECAGELYCEFDQEEANTCQTRKQLGNSCIGHNQCQTGHCIPGLCDNGNECFSDENCPGECTGTGAYCNYDEDCPGSCRLSGYSCYDYYDCDELYDLCDEITGKCAISNLDCSSYSDCPEMVELCIHERCQRTCQGRPVCGEFYLVVDYCTDTTAILFNQ